MNGQTFTCFFFFLNDPAPTEIYPLPLHDALPIYGNDSDRYRETMSGNSAASHNSNSRTKGAGAIPARFIIGLMFGLSLWAAQASLAQSTPDSGVDRKSTRLNSSHDQISYAVFCLK